MTLTPDKTSITKTIAGRRKISITAPVGWQSPFEAYQKIYVPNSFLLESVSGPLRIARYSIIGLEPHTIFQAKGSRMKIVDSGGERVFVGDPFKVLRQLCAEFEVRSNRPFCGGAVGYFSYDLGRFIEELPNLADDDLSLPDAVFFFCSQYVIFDHANETA